MNTDDLWLALSQVHWSAQAATDPSFSGKIYHASQPTPWGKCFIALQEESLCQMDFWDHEYERAACQQQLRQNWPQAQLADHPDRLQSVLHALATQQQGHLVLQGSPFQIQVWQALLTVPSGHRRCYQDLACQLGKASACRAVASAVAKNKIAYLIPCHRIVRKQGGAGHYRWGKNRKNALLHWESAVTAAPNVLTKR